MSDTIDMANEQAEHILEAELRRKRKEGPAPTGFCLNCSEPVAGVRRWCDAECRENFERIERARLRNGT